MARLALIGRNLVDAEILIVERVAAHFAIIVHQPRNHLDQDCLAGARRAVSDEGEKKPAQIDKRVQLPLEIIADQHLGQLHRLIFGNVIADDFVRLLERHRQGLAPRARGHIKAVQREIVFFDTHMTVLKGTEPLKPALPLKKPFNGHTGEGLGPLHHRRIVRRTVNGTGKTRQKCLDGILRRIEGVIGFIGVGARFGVGFQHAQEIGGERKCSHIGRCVQQRAEAVGIITFKRCRCVACLKGLKIRLPRIEIGNSQRDPHSAARPPDQPVLTG